MKKAYQSPEMKIFMLEERYDIITKSGEKGSSISLFDEDTSDDQSSSSGVWGE